MVFNIQSQLNSDDACKRAIKHMLLLYTANYIWITRKCEKIQNTM